MAPRKKQEDEFFSTPGEAVSGRKWEFAEGDALAGKVISIFEGDGDFGPYKGYTVEPLAQYTTEDGGDNSAVSSDDPLVWYVNDNSVSARRIAEAGGISISDDVRIDYHGKKPGKGNNSYHDFTVKVRSALATQA